MATTARFIAYVDTAPMLVDDVRRVLSRRVARGPRAVDASVVAAATWPALRPTPSGRAALLARELRTRPTAGSR